MSETITTTTVEQVVCQKWQEMEAGWGSRPDGYSLHLSEADREQYIKEYWDKMPDEVQEEYSAPDGTPYLVRATDITAEELKRLLASRNGIHGSNRTPPGSGGTDGWVSQKP